MRCTPRQPIWFDTPPDPKLKIVLIVKKAIMFQTISIREEHTFLDFSFLN